MTNRLAYPMLIAWSPEDDAYVVTVPDLPGCRTHGASYEEAARQGQDAIEGWLDAQREAGHPLPEPNTALADLLDPMRRLAVDPEQAASMERDLATLGIRNGGRLRRESA